jgi:secernin
MFTWSCDTVVALGDVTVDGSVLLAKNSDRSSHEAQRLIGAPAAEYAPNATVVCQYITIPQAPHTAALIGSQPYWLWGFEHGLNEHGVAIGNEAIWTRETPSESGLLGMDLVRLGLERGSTAQAALHAITVLLEEFGQGGSTVHHGVEHYDNSFLIADRSEAWVLETSGRRWVARRLASGTYALSNLPTIGTEYDLSSGDLVKYAEQRGWWPRGRRPFDFAAAYTDHQSDSLPSASCRVARSRFNLAAGAKRALDVPDMMALLRDHGKGPDGGMLSPAWPIDDQPGTVCAHGPADGGSTAASMVARLSPETLADYWASMAPPCTGVFVPCWVDAGPPTILGHAYEVADQTSPWWRFRCLWEAVAALPDPAGTVGRIRNAWRELEVSLGQRVGELGWSAGVDARRVVSEDAVAESLRVLACLERDLGVATLSASR